VAPSVLISPDISRVLIGRALWLPAETPVKLRVGYRDPSDAKVLNFADVLDTDMTFNRPLMVRRVFPESPSRVGAVIYTLTSDAKETKLINGQLKEARTETENLAKRFVQNNPDLFGGLGFDPNNIAEVDLVVTN